MTSLLKMTHHTISEFCSHLAFDKHFVGSQCEVIKLVTEQPDQKTTKYARTQTSYMNDQACMLRLFF